MPKTHRRISVPNPLAQDSSAAGVFTEIDQSFIKWMQDKKLCSNPLLVCSGGTSSRCVANNHWTLDLRKNYKQIKYDPIEETVEVGGGVQMKELLIELEKHNRSFPTGLSSLPGMGYILTGGISPLSRSQGLAIDQILEIKGIWGTGAYFNITRPSKESRNLDKITWKALCGAAPFFAIIESIKIKTFPLKKLILINLSATSKELPFLIKEAEKSPNSISFHWMWSNHITGCYVVTEKRDADSLITKLRSMNEKFDSFVLTELESIKDLTQSNLSLERSKPDQIFFEETLGLLGPEWGEDSLDIINKIEALIENRPNEKCYIAAQQLGGITNSVSIENTSFVHRSSAWKPWITTAWEANSDSSRERSLNWLEKAWGNLETNCPGIHLAQMHPHLSFHQREIKSAYGNWLDELQRLKSIYDPNGVLTPL